MTGNDDEVVIRVSNRGAPIAPELAERLFEPFKQDDAGGFGVRRGLGLGLFIVREIVRAHGGVVDVHAGNGLVIFTARLPRNTAVS